MKSFVAQLNESNALIQRGVDLSLLPPFLRVLLTTDGTVTSGLEAYFWESVAVEPFFQGLAILDHPEVAIACGEGDEVLMRKVRLRGASTQRQYAEAHSLIRSALLSDALRLELDSQRLGIGELIRDCGLETCREILEIGIDPSKQTAWRRYRIVMDHQPFIQITEHFPIHVYGRESTSEVL